MSRAHANTERKGGAAFFALLGDLEAVPDLRGVYDCASAHAVVMRSLSELGMPSTPLVNGFAKAMTWHLVQEVNGYGPGRAADHDAASAEALAFIDSQQQAEPANVRAAAPTIADEIQALYNVSSVLLALEQLGKPGDNISGTMVEGMASLANEVLLPLIERLDRLSSASLSQEGGAS